MMKEVALGAASFVVGGTVGCGVRTRMTGTGARHGGQA